jgi:uncharacterized damage-inducible protein DinB
MPIAAMLLPEFDQEMANTRKLLARVPEDKLNFTPHPKSMTLGRLAGHIAALPFWVTNIFSTETLDVVPGQPPPAPQSRQELLAAFDKNVEGLRAKLAGATDQQLSQTWTMTLGGKTVLSIPRASVLRMAFMNHLIHHRGQLGVYLRLNDVAIPGIYGPSADEM